MISTYDYVTYIRTTLEKLWEALTNSNLTEKYWFGRKVQSDWKDGSPVHFFDESGNVTDEGNLLIFEPHQRLSYTFLWVEDKSERGQAPQVTFSLVPMGDAVKLTLKHENLLPTDFYDESEGFMGINNGWPAILSNLKSLLETGSTLSSLTI